MSELTHFVIDADGDPEQIVDQVEFGLGKYEAAAEAEGGSVGTSSLTIMDPDGAFYMRGHRMMWDVETAAAGDDYAGVTWAGFGALREISRGEGMFVDSARTTVVTRHDVNTILDRRLNVGNDCDRPAETAGARVAWLLGTTEMALVSDDTTYVDTDDDTDMDAVDYTGQLVREVLDDCAQQSGRNFFLLWLDSGDPDEPVEVFLWYRMSSSADYASSIKISNLASDVDSSTVFAPSQETVLRRDPSRVYSGVYQAYDGGAVYEQLPVTGQKFAKRDTVGIAENVKSATAARFRAQRYLADIATELDEISTAIVVPAASVNGVMHGHRIQVKFTHLPGYESDYQWMRVKSRTVRTYTVGFYELALVLTGPSLEVLPGESEPDYDASIFARLSNCSGPYPSPSGDIHWNGIPVLPWEATSPEFDYVETGKGGHRWSGIQLTADGVLKSIVLRASAIGVALGVNEPYTVTWELCLNGVAIETYAIEVLVAGASNLWASGGPRLEALDVAVSTGDVISARLSCLPVAMEFFRSPLGIEPGVLIIRGGSF